MATNEFSTKSNTGLESIALLKEKATNAPKECITAPEPVENHNLAISKSLLLKLAHETASIKLYIFWMYSASRFIGTPED